MLLSNTHTPTESLLESQKQAAGDIGLHVNADKTECRSSNKKGNISTLIGGSLKWFDKLMYLRSSVSSTENDINMQLANAWTAINTLSIIWKSDLSDKVKRIFPNSGRVNYKRIQSVMIAIAQECYALYIKKKILDATSHKQLYGHLHPISKIIPIRRTRHARHCCRSRTEPISYVLLWTPSHGCASVDRPRRTYQQLLCTDTGCCLDNLLVAKDDRDEWRKRVRQIHARSTTWSWWYIKIIFKILIQDDWKVIPLLYHEYKRKFRQFS